MVDASAKYLRSVLFDDEVEVFTKLVAFSGVRMAFDYTIRFVSDGAVAVTGHTTHCFVDRNQVPSASSTATRNSLPRSWRWWRNNTSPQGEALGEGSP